MAAAVEVGDDRVAAPVAVAVDHIAAVAVREQRGIEAGVVGPGLRMRAEADLALLVAHDGGR